MEKQHICRLFAAGDMYYMLIREFLPKSLFGRALLILVLPTVLIQMLMTYIFFDRHWQAITRYMSYSLAGETAYLVMQLREMPERQKLEFTGNFEKATGLKIELLNNDDFETKNSSWKNIEQKNAEFPAYSALLASKINEQFIIRRLENSDNIEISVKLSGQILRIKTTAKRLESPTTNIYLFWMVGSSILLLLIAVIFLRNQLRPISKLAKAADNFGRGVDTPDFRPHGATEVRMAARAFIVMRERIKRQIRTRTDMLSGISHDLRTPLARMKLELALLEDSEVKADLAEDVQQMEHMINEYLDFARGEGSEEAVVCELHKLLAEVAADYSRSGDALKFIAGESVSMAIKPVAMRRMLHNLIDNALRYGKSAVMTYDYDHRFVRIIIDDEGEGIHETMRQEVFRPFVRLDASRNSKTGGVGLGLSIARDIALAHGGTIELSESPSGGLRVIIILPFEKTDKRN